MQKYNNTKKRKYESQCTSYERPWKFAKYINENSNNDTSHKTIDHSSYTSDGGHSSNEIILNDVSDESSTATIYDPFYESSDESTYDPSYDSSDEEYPANKTCSSEYNIDKIGYVSELIKQLVSGPKLPIFCI